MSRPKNTVAPVEWAVHLPSDLAAQVELLLTDPLREKVRYGARSKLIERLLRAWLEMRKEELRNGAELSRL